MRLYYFVSYNYDRDLWYVNINTWENVNLTVSSNRIESCFTFGDYKCMFYPNSPEHMLIVSEPIPTPLPTGQIYIPQWVTSRRLTEIDTNAGTYNILDANNEIFDAPSVSPDGSTIAYDRGNP